MTWQGRAATLMRPDPFFGHDGDGQKANETLDPLAPVMAEGNPYIRAALEGRPVRPVCNARNSLNHGGQGQNVLFGDLHVEFCERPTRGLDGDNIYAHGSGGVSPARLPFAPMRLR